MPLNVLLSCGEPSGDLYAGALLRELRALEPGLRARGLGGPQFAAAGGELIEDYRDVAVTGLTEVVRKLPLVYRTLERLVDSARSARPDALVVIDFPDFNFRLARAVKKLGVPVVYYISPQVWAWRPGRINTIREIADRVLVIFPFEEELYREAGVPVEFVGHPLVELAAHAESRDRAAADLNLDTSRRIVAVLPGSRPNEVREILPTLLDAAVRIRARIPDVQFVIARAPNLRDELFAGARTNDAVSIVEGRTDAVLAAANLALVASGTATVQAALHDAPMVVVYRLSALTYRLGRRFVTVDTYAMVNLIAGDRIVPELIQDGFTADTVTTEALALLTDSARVARMREGLAQVRSRLGGPGASRRAAQAVLGAMHGTIKSSRD